MCGERFNSHLPDSTFVVIFDFYAPLYISELQVFHVNHLNTCTKQIHACTNDLSNYPSTLSPKMNHQYTQSIYPITTTQLHIYTEFLFKIYFIFSLFTNLGHNSHDRSPSRLKLTHCLHKFICNNPHPKSLFIFK